MSKLKDSAGRYEAFVVQFAALAEELRDCKSAAERIDVLEKTGFLIGKADELIVEYEKELVEKIERAKKATA